MKGEIRLNPINILSTEVQTGSVPCVEISRLVLILMMLLDFKISISNLI